MKQEVIYYCGNCTAQRPQGTRCCAFCCEPGYYHYLVSKPNTKVFGSGFIKLHMIEVPNAGEPINQAQSSTPTPETTREQLAAYNDINDRATDEEVEFNKAIRQIRIAFDNLKRCRKDRRRSDDMVQDLKAQATGHLKTIEELQRNVSALTSAAHHYEKEVGKVVGDRDLANIRADKAEEDLAIAQKTLDNLQKDIANYVNIRVQRP